MGYAPVRNRWLRRHCTQVMNRRIGWKAIILVASGNIENRWILTCVCSGLTDFVTSDSYMLGNWIPLILSNWLSLTKSKSSILIMLVDWCFPMFGPTFLDNIKQISTPPTPQPIGSNLLPNTASTISTITLYAYCIS